MSGLFGKLQSKVENLTSDVVHRVGATGNSGPKHSHTHGGECDSGVHDDTDHRFGSFAPTTDGNEVKWYVDGCSYMWAVSRALETASHSIWIMDWWLSPELYLRRPPSKFESYRLDRMLLAAAERGVKVNIIIYKEVTQALTLCSSHTKHALENLSPNICVFRHPDHLPDAQTFQSSFTSSLQNLKLTAANTAKLPGDALKAIYGANDDVVLYWAHHEKLCLVDAAIAFMGGLDLCYGRWDTNDHPIADAHPGDLNKIVFPGQDFNNARIMDFQDVNHWENNKLDRKTNSRMGWSDLSISLRGQVVEDLRIHFVDRWNFIYNEKYDVRKDTRYSRLTLRLPGVGALPFGMHGSQQPSQATTPYGPPGNAQSPYLPPGQPLPPPVAQGNQAYSPHGTQDQSASPYFPPPPTQASRGVEDENGGQTERGLTGDHQHTHLRHGNEGGMREHLKDKLQGHMQHAENEYYEHQNRRHHFYSLEAGVPCQIVRSCGKWSHGVATEHSIANAYIKLIRDSQHFIYIENQFFITATDPAQKPVMNKIGAAIVERVVRAAKAGQKFKIIVIMPAVPAFAGDLKDESSLGTRAIMEFQYNSINRGGKSIMESIAAQGFNPTDYIRFYNLRNYDRINASATMAEVEKKSGVSYEDARRQHDDIAGAGFAGKGEGTGASNYAQADQYQKYQQAAEQLPREEGLNDGRWDSLSECYMLNGPDVRTAPFPPGVSTELDAFVSEELYVHSKIMIIDDRTVICGSANLNDRSQAGYNDSEIAIVIEDQTPLPSSMDGQQWRASRFAGTLRRQLFRKHLGLIPAQDMEHPTENFEPVGTAPNVYDYGSREDVAVADPLSDAFQNMWNATAHQNTEVFGRIFHPVPHDRVRNWKDYDEFFTKYFHEQGDKDHKVPAKYKIGHVVAEEFPPGPDGLREVKELLSTVRGTLVEMPLLFLIEEDIAREGLGLNAFTENVYT